MSDIWSVETGPSKRSIAITVAGIVLLVGVLAALAIDWASAHPEFMRALNGPSYQERQAQLESQVPEGCQRIYEFGQGRSYLTGYRCPPD